MMAYFDLHSLSEDERISVLGQQATTHPGEILAFFVEDDPKADRYIRKLQASFPKIRIIDRTPSMGTVLVRFTGGEVQ